MLILNFSGAQIRHISLIAEVQATAEGATYDEEALLRLLRLARIGCKDIFAAQDQATGR